MSGNGVDMVVMKIDDSNQRRSVGKYQLEMEKSEERGGMDW